MSDSKVQPGEVTVGRCYKNSPIVEAVCEFRFIPDPNWDMAIPGLFYESVKAEFPARKGRNTVSLGLSLGNEETTHQVTTGKLVQFIREDGQELLQVGENLLSVNRLKPYGVWEEFRDLIDRSFGQFCEIAKPGGLARIGLRYINVIEIDADPVKLEHFFDFYPKLGDRLPQEFTTFIAGIETPYEGGRDLRRLTMTPSGSPSEESVTSILLDIDYGLQKPSEVPMEKALEWVEVAHRHVESTFEACITDDLRVLFGLEG